MCKCLSCPSLVPGVGGEMMVPYQGGNSSSRQCIACTLVHRPQKTTTASSLSLGASAHKGSIRRHRSRSVQRGPHHSFRFSRGNATIDRYVRFAAPLIHIQDTGAPLVFLPIEHFMIKAHLLSRQSPSPCTCDSSSGGGGHFFRPQSA